MNECIGCGFYDSDREGCTCYSHEKWYACPIESRKPENIKMMDEYVNYLSKQEEQDDR